MHRGVRLASKRAILAAVGSIALVVAAGWGSEACRDATQVTVDIRTLGIPCSSLRGVAIVVARGPQEAEDRMALGSFSAQVERGVCDGARVGTLVLTPSETLPVTLEVACADVPCDVVSSCRSGTCVSSETTCTETASSRRTQRSSSAADAGAHHRELAPPHLRQAVISRRGSRRASA